MSQGCGQDDWKTKLWNTKQSLHFHGVSQEFQSKIARSTGKGIVTMLVTQCGTTLESIDYSLACLYASSSCRGKIVRHECCRMSIGKRQPVRKHCSVISTYTSNEKKPPFNPVICALSSTWSSMTRTDNFPMPIYIEMSKFQLS